MKNSRLLISSLFFLTIIFGSQESFAQQSSKMRMEPLMIKGGDMLFEEHIDTPSNSKFNAKGKNEYNNDEYQFVSFFTNAGETDFISNNIRDKGPQFDKHIILPVEEASFELYSLEFTEGILELEGWMIDYSWIQAEVINEDALLMEAWMVDCSWIESEVVNETALLMEAWMMDCSWIESEVVNEDALLMESWMMDCSWIEAKEIDAEMIVMEAWMSQPKSWNVN